MLGAAQESWLEAGLTALPARRNVLAQQFLFAEFRQGMAAKPLWWTAAWDGYPAARRRQTDFMVARKIANPIILDGDVHCFYATDIRAIFLTRGRRWWPACSSAP
ncbi:MAG: hypothetical protein EXR01_01150 [Acetobacteraceae bacterium]|nr:hypothetical protein [Acetobacteraceae bacterium]